MFFDLCKYIVFMFYTSTPLTRGAAWEQPLSPRAFAKGISARQVQELRLMLWTYTGVATPEHHHESS